MLPSWFVVFAVVIRLLGGLTYARAVISGRAKPNPITWFFWALTPAIVFVAQLFSGVGWSIASTFALGLGPLVIFFLSLKHNLNRSHFTPFTVGCGVFASIGILLWLGTNDPSLAIIFSIMADIFGSMPTVLKAWRDPSSEFAPSYALSMLAMVVTLGTITAWDFASAAFPIYIFLINFVIFGLIVWPRKKPQKRRRKLDNTARRKR